MNIKQVLQKIRVPAGFLFALIFFIISRPTTVYMLAGLPFVIAGVWIRFWAAGHIRKSREITTSGPYARTRNPLYVGSFFLGIGFCIQSAILFLLPLFVIVFFLIYYPVMRQEEWELERVFGEEYAGYRAHIPLFMPLPGRKMKTRRRFSLSQALGNREYNAPLGALVAEIILVVKLFYPLVWP